MAKTRSPKKLFNIVIKYHSYFNDKYTSPYMCHAADQAFLNKKITLPECVMVRKMCADLVKSYSQEKDSLEGALKAAGVIGIHTPRKQVEYIIKDTWRKYIKTLENQDG